MPPEYLLTKSENKTKVLPCSAPFRTRPAPLQRLETPAPEPLWRSCCKISAPSFIAGTHPLRPRPAFRQVSPTSIGCWEVAFHGVGSAKSPARIPRVAPRWPSHCWRGRPELASWRQWSTARTLSIRLRPTAREPCSTACSGFAPRAAERLCAVPNGCWKPTALRWCCSTWPSRTSALPRPPAPRLARAAASTGAALVVVTRDRVMGTAAEVAIELTPAQTHFTGTPTLLEGLDIRAALVRHPRALDQRCTTVRLRSSRAA